MKKRVYIFLILSIIFSAILTGCANIKSMRVNAQMKSAQKYLLEEDYEKAIVKLEKTIAIDPKNIDAYILLAKAYQEADMQEEAEEIIDKIRDINGVRLSSIQKEKVSALDSKRIYSEILNNFYKTGIIGDVDELYWLDYANEISSLDDDLTPCYYYFTLEDVTGDGKDEIIIGKKYKSLGSESGYIYEVIKGRAVRIGYIDSYRILTDNNLLVNSFVDSETKEEKTQVFSYYASIADFIILDKDKHSKEIEEAKEMIANNKIKLKVDDIVTPLNPENIKEAVDKMSLQDIDSIDEEDKSSDNEESTITNNKRKKKDKEVYEKWRSNYFKINEEDHGRFELMDITGDNRDELIVKLGDDGDSYSCVIFGTLGNEIYILASGHSDDFRMFEDNSILFVSENMDNSKKFEYYKYDRDIRRFYMEKAGQYREGDLEYLDKLLEKKVKLTGDDIDTELTKENLDVAFGD
jgi:lipoprotein